MSVKELTKFLARLLAVLVACASLTLVAQPAYASPPRVTIDHVIYELDGDPYFRATIVGDDGLLGDTLAPPSSITVGGQVYAVTGIGTSAFENNVILRHVTLPNSILFIGVGAFRQMASSPSAGITDIQLNEGLVAIGASAFINTQLVELILPDTVTTLGNGFASQIVTLTSLYIPEGIATIPNHAFSYDISLSGVQLPSSLQSIGQSAFYLAPLEYIDIPGNVTSIGWQAFNNWHTIQVTFQGAPPTLLTQSSGTFNLTAAMIFTCPFASSITAGQWQGYDAEAQCSVSYHGTGDSMIPYGITQYGGQFTRPADPVREGYTFAGWYTSSSLSTPFDFNQIVTSDQDAYAKWEVATAPQLASTGANGGAVALMASESVLLFVLGLAGVVVARHRSKATQ